MFELSGEFSNCHLLLTEKELAECVAEDRREKEEFSETMDILLNTPYDLLPEEARDKMTETHEDCSPIGNGCYDCGHDPIGYCDCHVCQ